MHTELISTLNTGSYFTVMGWCLHGQIQQIVTISISMTVYHGKKIAKRCLLCRMVFSSIACQQYSVFFSIQTKRSIFTGQWTGEVTPFVMSADVSVWKVLCNLHFRDIPLYGSIWKTTSWERQNLLAVLRVFFFSFLSWFVSPLVIDIFRFWLVLGVMKVQLLKC